MKMETICKYQRAITENTIEAWKTYKIIKKNFQINIETEKKFNLIRSVIQIAKKLSGAK